MIELDEEQLFYLDHHEHILPKPLFAERLGIKQHELDRILKQRREARLLERTERWRVVIA